jgi:hypothetical protein
MAEQTTKAELAQTILGLTFGTLMEIAGEMSRMKEPSVRPKIETPEEFASMLHDWADATNDD